MADAMSWMLVSRGYHSTRAVAPTSVNSQITRFVRLGLINVARKLFDELPNKNVVSWNAIIAGYLQSEQPEEARKLFDRMPDRNVVSWNGLLSGYVGNGMIAEARKVFDEMPQRNVVSWTAMVKGYVQEGMVNEAEGLFWEMPERNVVSWTVIVRGLIEDGRVEEAKRMFDRMPVKDVVARTNMIGGLCSVGRLSEARKIFDEMPMRNVVTWTAMISGYCLNGKVDLGRKLFEVAPQKNEVTWTAMLTGYTRCGRIEEAAQIFEVMSIKPVAACNEMIMGYGTNGRVKKARSVFERMQERDDVTWSSMIKVYERNGLKSLDHGKQVHTYLVRCQFDLDIYVSSVLISMYIRCGDLLRGKRVFDMFPTKDVVMWNSIITGYAQHGLGEEALNIFHEMFNSGVAPDEVTFIGVLTSCTHTGKVHEGLEIFESMKSKYSVEPRTEHYACMVDLLSRAGRLKEALDLIQNMTVEADATVWGALLSSCRTHMELDLAELAAKKLVQLEPENAGPYILLSDIYASQGRWQDVEELRETMRARRVKKSPGRSWGLGESISMYSLHGISSACTPCVETKKIMPLQDCNALSFCSESIFVENL